MTDVALRDANLHELEGMRLESVKISRYRHCDRAISLTFRPMLGDDEFNLNLFASPPVLIGAAIDSIGNLVTKAQKGENQDFIIYLENGNWLSHGTGPVVDEPKTNCWTV